MCKSKFGGGNADSCACVYGCDKKRSIIGATGSCAGDGCTLNAAKSGCDGIGCTFTPPESSEARETCDLHCDATCAPQTEQNGGDGVNCACGCGAGADRHRPFSHYVTVLVQTC
jgi:hypothetical protein